MTDKVLAGALRYRTLCAAVLFFLLPVQASAWNFAGHRLSACIAWDQLSPSSREKVARLLREHPDYARWTRKASDDSRDRTAFIEASIWADLIRHDPRFHDAGDEATPLLPGFPEMENHGDWHYVNRPLAGYPAARNGDSANTGQLDKQLAALTATLGAHASPEASASSIYALPWLIHLVADAHQPLHTVDADAAWIAPEGNPKAFNPSAPRKRTTSLHAFWDDLPGASLSGKNLDSACRALATLYPAAPPSGPKQWIDESWRIARSDGFPPSYSEMPRISKAFYENAQEIANQRIVAAGYRLADLLNQQLK